MLQDFRGIDQSIYNLKRFSLQSPGKTLLKRTSEEVRYALWRTLSSYFVSRLIPGSCSGKYVKIRVRFSFSLTVMNLKQ